MTSKLILPRDFSRCTDKDCPLSEYCLRYTDVDGDYLSFMPTFRDEGATTCLYFIPNDLWVEKEVEDKP